MTHRFLPGLLGFICALCILACGPNYLYQETKTLGDAGWTYQDSLDFPFSISDTNRIYNLYLDVEHDNSYPFQNMYIKIHTAFPDGQRPAQQVSINMADKVGQWYGNCGSTRCELRVPIQTGAFFNQAGDYQVTIEQFMRRDPLPGIKTLSFRIEDTGQQRNEK
ncbi:MAG: gliding motility lipoprotein GldH [Bacteroidota bacterium]